MSDLESTTYGDEPDDRHAIGANNPPFDEVLKGEHKELFLELDALKLAKEKVKPVIDSDDELESIGRLVVSARNLIKKAAKAHTEAKAPFKAKADICDAVFLSKGLKGEVENLLAFIQAIADDYTTRKAEAERERLRKAAEELRQQEENQAYETAALKEAGAHGVAEVVESQSEHTARAADKLESKADGAVKDVVRTRFEGVTAGGRTVWTYEIEDAAKVDLDLLRRHIFDHELRQMIDRYVAAGGRKLPGVRIFEKVVSTFR